MLRSTLKLYCFIAQQIESAWLNFKLQRRVQKDLYKYTQQLCSMFLCSPFEMESSNSGYEDALILLHGQEWFLVSPGKTYFNVEL